MKISCEIDQEEALKITELLNFFVKKYKLSKGAWYKFDIYFQDTVRDGLYYCNLRLHQITVGDGDDKS